MDRIDHLSARVAIESAKSITLRMENRRASRRDVAHADPMVAAKARWVRSVLASSVKGMQK